MHNVCPKFSTWSCLYTKLIINGPSIGQLLPDRSEIHTLTFDVRTVLYFIRKSGEKEEQEFFLIM